jgi:hypothetical protein
MADRGQDAEDNESLSSSGEEEIKVQSTETPTCRNLPTTITIKRRHKEKKSRKPRDETT